MWIWLVSDRILLISATAQPRLSLMINLVFFFFFLFLITIVKFQTNLLYLIKRNFFLKKGFYRSQWALVYMVLPPTIRMWWRWVLGLRHTGCMFNFLIKSQKKKGNERKNRKPWRKFQMLWKDTSPSHYFWSIFVIPTI